MFSWDEWANLDGFIEPKEGFLLYNEVLQLPCQSTIVEIGCYHGKSTVALLEGCKDSSCTNDKKKIVSSVDYFAGQGMTESETTPEETATGMEIVNCVVREWGVTPWFAGVVAMKSQDWFSQHTELHGKVDMMFLDGCHPIVDQDLTHALPYFHSGSVVLCHDYWPHDHPFSWITRKIESVGLSFTRLEDTNLGKSIIP